MTVAVVAAAIVGAFTFGLFVGLVLSAWDGPDASDLIGGPPRARDAVMLVEPGPYDWEADEERVRRREALQVLDGGAA